MMTSLARQLQALRSDVVATLDKRKHHRVASLLLDPDEAAGQTIEAIYSLGVNGLSGLVLLEPQFEKFGRTLFAENAKEIDRAVQTKAENDDVDFGVVEFLDLVAPYALTREAAKALEWLIRRFKIHKFPVTAETLLFTFLPHHKEPVYTRLVQIVSLPPHFTFLSQYTNLKISSALPPVPAQLLVRNLSRDTVLLEAYQTYIQTRAKKHILPTLAIHKYLVLVGETILAMREARVAEETVVARILPFIAAGLKMRRSPEFQIACYSLLAILASKRTLEGRVVDAAMEAICLGWSEESLKSGILCVSALASVKEDGQIPVAVKKAVWGVENLSAVIEGMLSKSSTSKFIVSLVEYGISLPDEGNKEVITALVTSEKLETGDRRMLVQNAVEKALGGNKSVGKWITAFSRSHTEQFRNLFEMLTLEGEKVSKLEKLTNLELKATDEMAEIEYTTQPAVTVDPWSLLPTELINPSFFASPTEYKIFADVYSAAITSSNQGNIQKFLSLPLLQTNPLSLPTFLARTWITPFLPVPVRTASLTHFTTPLSPTTTHDLQGFLPHILVALLSPHKPIRVAAGALLTKLHSMYTSSTKHSIVGLMEMYAVDVASLNTLKWLSIPEVKWLLSILLGKSSECELDPEYTRRLLGEVLNEAGKKGKKDQQPTSLMVFLASHVACSGLPALQDPLLRLLISTGVESASAVKLRAQSLETFLEQCKDSEFVTELLGRERGLDGASFAALLAQIVGPGAGGSQVGILMDLVSGKGPLAVDACRQLAVVFPATRQATQLSIARMLISQVDAGTPALAKVASSTLDEIVLPGPVILSLLDDVKIDVDAESSPARKKQRTESPRASPPPATDGTMHSIRRLISLLEVLERQNPEDHPEIAGPLFVALDGLIAVESNTRTSFNYAKQLVLSCLISIVKVLDTGEVDTGSFRVDSLISCIRTSTNPQVHNRTLLLLSELARFAPNLVLNHVMPIFTFMGSNVLRQDDDYTALVIEQTIKTVVPMLMADRAAGITPVIAFVNNFDFIPKHRRLALFRVLIETVGADECLPTTLFLLVEKACETKNKKKSLASEFGSDLLKSFPLSTQLAAVDSFLRMIMFIPRDPNEVVESLPVELAGYSASKLGSLKRDCLGIVASELESKSFQGAVLRIHAAGEVDNAVFSSIAEKLLLVRADCDGVRRLIETSLEGLLASLSLPSVVDIVETFVQTNRDTGVTSKMIPIAAARLVRTPATDSACQMAISKLLPLLSDILKAGVDVESSGVALDSIAKLSRVHGKAHVAQFEDILPVLMEHGIWSSREKTVHDTLNCLFVMMLVLDARILPFLPDLMTLIMTLLGLDDPPSTDVQISMIRLMTRLYQRIPSFMNAYLPGVLPLVLSAYAKKDESSDVIEARDDLLHRITENVPTDVCVERLSACWSTVLHTRRVLTIFTETFGGIIASGTREDLTSSSKVFFDLFLKLFGIRGELDLKPKAIKSLEKQLTEAFLKLVMKLNDTTFRPFFITLRDWAFRNTEGDVRTSRLLFFFSFMNDFIKTLQTVVTSYYGIILDDTVALLNDFESRKATSKDLWISVVQSLQKSFSHDLDQDSYWSCPSRFEKIIHPLLHQLPLPYKTKTLIPAIVAITTKARSEENCKVINTVLMEYMKAEAAEVRLSAVQTQKALFEELSSEWLKVLPPLVPVISELMEDENEGVVEGTHELIATIESVGGISMQKLLT